MKRSTQEHAKNEKWEGGSRNWTDSISEQRLRQMSQEERFGRARQYGERTKLAWRGWPTRTQDPPGTVVVLKGRILIEECYKQYAEISILEDELNLKDKLIRIINSELTKGKLTKGNTEKSREHIKKLDKGLLYDEEVYNS